MKKNVLGLSIAAFAFALLAACSSTPIPPSDGGGTQTATGGPGSGIGTIDNSGVNSGDMLPPELANKRSIFFDYDSYVVKDEFRPTLIAHANFMKAHPQHHVILQGNTDERGGSEYNLALGQKRAEAVRKALVLLGVSDSQLEAVSFGKEKPMAQGHDEAAYAQNRRVDLAY
jgi:peptidoglycan-associated lipoprotein